MKTRLNWRAQSREGKGDNGQSLRTANGAVVESLEVRDLRWS